MANYAPVIIKNGELQQLQATDGLVVPLLSVKGVGAGSISNATVDTDPTGIARFSVSESGALKGVFQYIGSTFATPSLQNLITMGSIGLTPIGFVYNSVERMRLQTGLNIGGVLDPSTGRLYITGASGGVAMLGLHPDGADSHSTALTIIADITASYFIEYRNVPLIFTLNGTERMRLRTGLNIGGITDPGAGNLSVAGTINGLNLDTGAWTAWTPTIGVNTGTITATPTAAYKQIGRIVHYRISITVTALTGSGWAYVSFTLPVAAAVSNSMPGYGVERGVSGRGLAVNSSGTTGATIRFADASFPGAVGNILVVAGTYEAATTGLLRAKLKDSTDGQPK